MKKTKLGLWTVIAAGAMFSLTACKIDSSRNVSNNGGGTLAETPAVTVAQTEPTVPIESTASAELTEAETTAKEAENDLQKLLWWEDELGEGGKILYPGFELDCEIKDGGYYRVFRSEEKGIELLERVFEVEKGFPISRGDVTLRNAGGSKDYTVYASIGNRYDKNTFSEDEKKVFFQDLTNDGREELVVSIPFRDMQTDKNYVYIFDSQTLEQLPLPDGDVLRGKIASEIGVAIKEVKDGTVTAEITIGGGTYEGSAKIHPEWTADDLEYEIGVSYGGYYVGDSGAYYRAVVYIYHKDYPESVNNGMIDINIPVVYYPELHAFEAAEKEYGVSSVGEKD